MKKFNSYALFIDSTKLFFMNVFIYVLFLEAYIVGALAQGRFRIELPFLTIFISGAFIFIAITIWMNVANVWYQRIKDAQSMLLRALTSELPFIALLMIVYLVWAADPGLFRGKPDGFFLMMLFVVLTVAFPVVMVVTKSHKESLNKR